MKHTMFARETELFLTNDDERRRFDGLVERLTIEFAPATAQETRDLLSLAHLYWELERFEGLAAAAWGAFSSPALPQDRAVLERLGDAVTVCGALLVDAETAFPPVHRPEDAERLAWLVEETAFTAPAAFTGIDLARAEAWRRDVEQSPAPDRPAWRSVVAALHTHGLRVRGERQREAEQYELDRRAYFTEALEGLDRHDAIGRQRTRVERAIDRLVKRMPKRGLLPHGPVIDPGWQGGFR